MPRDTAVTVIASPTWTVLDMTLISTYGLAVPLGNGVGGIAVGVALASIGVGASTGENWQPANSSIKSSTQSDICFN